MSKERIHLVGKGCSGRAVTIRSLRPKECDRALIAASKSMGPSSTQMELRLATEREAVKMMLVEVTKETSLVDDFRVDPNTKWVKVTMQDLDDESGPLSYDTLFTPKDDGILTNIYRLSADPSPAEVELIVSKSIPLAD